MKCPYCENEILPGTRKCASCGASLPQNANMEGTVSHASAAVQTTPRELSPVFAWLLAGVPGFTFMFLVLLAGLFEPETESAAEFTMTLVWIAYLVMNIFFIHKDEQLLDEVGHRDDLTKFMHIGRFVPPVYLIARASKIGKQWGCAIVGSMVWVWWIWWVLTD